MKSLGPILALATLMGPACASGLIDNKYGEIIVENKPASTEAAIPVYDSVSQPAADVVDEVIAFGWEEQESAPQTMFVDGEIGGGGYNQPVGRLRVVGRLYNWNYDDLPMPDSHERLDRSIRVPLIFEGRVKVGVEKNTTCHGVRLALYRGARKIM